MKKKGVPKGPLGKFIIVDILIIFAALSFAFLIRFQDFSAEHIKIYYILIVPIVLVRIGSLYVFGLYDFSRGFTTFDVIYFTGCAMIVAHAIEVLTILYTGTFIVNPDLRASKMAPNEVVSETPKTTGEGGKFGQDTIDEAPVQYSRYILVLNFVLSWAGASTWRILYLKRRRRWAYDRTRLLIVGAGELGESVQREIQQYSRLGHEVIGLVDDDIESRTNGAAVLGRMRDLPNLVQTNEIEEIIVTSRQANREELLNIISTCQDTGCKIRLLPELYEVIIGHVEIGQVAGVPLISVNSTEINEWIIFIKRLLDLTVSSICLIFLLPCFPFIALAIKYSSSGPVFYRQKRIGKNGRLFILYKFRTMYEDAEMESGPVLSWENDPRVTPVGRFLRRWHLDETPQFFNVLKGEMSLVGPRPERPHFAQQHKEEIPAYQLRETVRPGMTGLAQIHGFYYSPVEHKLRYDLAYIHNMSLLLDLKILFLTLRVTFSGHGPQI